MIRFDILSAVPALLESPINHSIIKIARDKKLAEIHTHDLRDYSEDKHRKIDDYPYGGGAGMVLTPQPIFSCINHLKSARNYDEIIFMTPDAPVFTQQDANRLSLCSHVMILCGHYKGVDQRVRDTLITKEYSVGDFVLSGGELPALIIADATIRLIPGVLGDSESALTDSFMDGLLDSPAYTRPAVFEGMEVPEILRSGNHENVREWRLEQSEEKTRQLRPDLYKIFLNKHS
jgi:tRNA (guanine37-N1)-methyltransferase